MGDVMDTATAAERAGVTVRTIMRWLKSGRLQARRFGRFYVIDSDDLERAKAYQPKLGRPRKESRG